jgi:hypothetical protein
MLRASQPATQHGAAHPVRPNLGWPQLPGPAANPRHSLWSTATQYTSTPTTDRPSGEARPCFSALAGQHPHHSHTPGAPVDPLPCRMQVAGEMVSRINGTAGPGGRRCCSGRPTLLSTLETTPLHDGRRTAPQHRHSCSVPEHCNSWQTLGETVHSARCILSSASQTPSTGSTHRGSSPCSCRPAPAASISDSARVQCPNNPLHLR